MILKNRKKIIIITIILGIVICCGGIYILLLRYFFFNKYNIHAQREALDSLNRLYNQEFEIISRKFETKEVESGGYVHLWTYTLRDDQRRQFYVYGRWYGPIEKGDGNPYAVEYYDFSEDTYGQLCIEERLGSKYDLNQYRQEKGSRLNDDSKWADYIFICTENNVDEIAELLTDMYFEETEFSNGGCLICLVNNEKGETLFTYYWWDITRELRKQKKRITEETVHAYILESLED